MAHLRARQLWIVTDADFAAAVAEGVQAAGERMIPAAVAECLREIGLHASAEGGTVLVRVPLDWTPPTEIDTARRFEA